MAVWRLQVRTGGTNISQYCLKNNVVSMGWSLLDLDGTQRGLINTFKDYCDLAKDEYRQFDSVCRMVEDVKENDLIWMRSEGKYYIARIKQESAWQFCDTDEAREMDACNQLTNIKWYPATQYADEYSVPGSVATAFIRGSTIQRIKKTGIEEYSQMLFNEIHDISEDSFTYDNPNLSLNEENFYSLLQPEDVEDLLCLWLYNTKGYICIPSTNKIATPKYECVLIDPRDKRGKHIYIQVKKGNVDLKTDDYFELVGEVYLLTTGGEIQNADKHVNVHAVSSKEIFEFATNPEKTHLVPESVLLWVKFLTDVENKNRVEAGAKGIMFDTNLSYSADNEREMLSQNRICAYGQAKRYINSFNLGDYAFYYSKGRGIIAIGKIHSNKAKELIEEDGLYHDVELIVPNLSKWDENNVFWLSAREIKEILQRDFYFASTIKTPFLNEEQVQLLIDELEKKYNPNNV